MQPLLPHPLHHEVVGDPTDPAPVPHVQAGVEVQRVKTAIARRRTLLSSKSEFCRYGYNSKWESSKVTFSVDLLLNMSEL